MHGKEVGVARVVRARFLCFQYRVRLSRYIQTTKQINKALEQFQRQRSQITGREHIRISYAEHKTKYGSDSQPILKHLAQDMRRSE